MSDPPPTFCTEKEGLKKACGYIQFNSFARFPEIRNAVVRFSRINFQALFRPFRMAWGGADIPGTYENTGGGRA